MRMKIDKNKLKYRIMAVLLTMSVILSYVAVFVTESYAYSGTSSLVPFGTVSADMRNESGKVVRGNGTFYVTSKWLSTHDLVKDLCLVVEAYTDSNDQSRYNIGINVNGVIDGNTETYTYLKTQYDTIESCGAVGGQLGAYSYTSSVYVFKDRASAKSYLAGTMSESELMQNALNYNDVMFGSASYDSSVPSPDKLYIDSLSSTSVSAVWSYSNNSTSLDNVTYKVEVENFYVTTSLFNSIAKGWSGKTGESSWKFNGTIDECNRLKGMNTVETYLSSPTKILADEVLVSANVISDSGVMHSTNTYVCTPTDYSDEFASSGNAFFTGATNSHWAEYCGSQVTVTPYMTIDGVTKKGATVVCRRFTSDMLNTIVGSTYTKVGTDDNGKEYIESTNRQDNTGSSIGEYEKLDTDNVMTFIKDGFGILGSNGVLALAQTVFLGVPTYIWMLYGTLIAVTIVVIVFKIARGF